MNRPEATAKVLNDGWYNSGDLGYLDPDGFLKITGRLSRFSKIAGEMVPASRCRVGDHGGRRGRRPDPGGHGRPRRQAAGAPGRDPRQAADRAAGNLQKTSRSRPAQALDSAAEDFIEVDAVPRLGIGGKLDLRRLKEIALERTRS